MKSAEEQLTEYRTSFVKNLYKGQPGSIVNAAIEDIELMNFESIEKFESWASNKFENDPNREASVAELKAVFGEDYEAPKTSTIEATVEEAFGNFKL